MFDRTEDLVDYHATFEYKCISPIISTVVYRTDYTLYHYAIGSLTLFLLSVVVVFVDDDISVNDVKDQLKRIHHFDVSAFLFPDQRS